MRTPIQIIVLRNPSDERTDVYVDTLRLAFEGSAAATGSPNAYIADAIDLGIRVLEPVSGIGDDEAERLIGGARHTIVVVIGATSVHPKSVLKRVDEENGDYKLD